MLEELSWDGFCGRVVGKIIKNYKLLQKRKPNHRLLRVININPDGEGFLPDSAFYEGAGPHEDEFYPVLACVRFYNAIEDALAGRRYSRYDVSSCPKVEDGERKIRELEALAADKEFRF